MKLVNNKRFTHKSIYHNGKYYFFDTIGEINGQVTLSICYYTRGRFGKWYEDTAYMTNIPFARELFQFAIKKGLTDTMPKLLQENS